MLSTHAIEQIAREAGRRVRGPRPPDIEFSARGPDGSNAIHDEFRAAIGALSARTFTAPYPVKALPLTEEEAARIRFALDARVAAGRGERLTDEQQQALEWWKKSHPTPRGAEKTTEEADTSVPRVGITLGPDGAAQYRLRRS